MNIIFVDIDGPLIPRKMHMFHQNRKTGKENHPQFDAFSIRAFNLWAKYGNAKIVFSTAWAHNYSVDELKAIMLHNGLGFDYHDEILTPKKMTSSRGSEIVWWLQQFSKEGDKFIAVDDDTSCRYIKQIMDHPRADTVAAEGQWIEVEFDNGLSWDNFLDGCDTLGIDIDDIYEAEFGIKKLTDAEKKARHTYLNHLV